MFATSILHLTRFLSLSLSVLAILLVILLGLRLKQKVLEVPNRCLPDKLLQLDYQPVEVVLLSEVHPVVLSLQEGVLH